MKRSLLFVLLTTAISFGAAQAFAEHHKGGHETEKHEMKADVNNDGKVSFDEFKTAREARMAEHFKRRDTNGDGFIDAGEKADARKHFRSHRKHKKDRCERKHD